MVGVHTKNPYSSTYARTYDEITGTSTNGLLPKVWCGFSHSFALKIPGYACFCCNYYWLIYQQGDKIDTKTMLQAC
jgi:hypothetical protein